MATRAAWWCLAGTATLLATGCKSVPDLVYDDGEAGSQADGDIPPEGDAQAADGQNPVDGQAAAESGADGSGSSDASDGGAKGDAVAEDAGHDADAATDGGWTNTCPGTVPPGATRCDGNTACFERQAGDCSNASGDCMSICGTTKVCCIDNNQNVTCKSDPSQCP
jgi:hypothetical protein